MSAPGGTPGQAIGRVHAWGLAALALALILGAASIALDLAGPRSIGSSRLGHFAILFALLIGAVFFVSVAPLQRYPHTGMSCLVNVMRIAQSLQMYRADADGTFPLARHWPGVALSYGLDETDLICPADPDLRGSYAYNQALSGMMYDAMADPSHVVAIFESDAAWLASGGPELLPKEPRRSHLGGDNYGFADGHQRWLPRRKLPADPSGWAKGTDADWVRWEP